MTLTTTRRLPPSPSAKLTRGQPAAKASQPCRRRGKPDRAQLAGAPRTHRPSTAARWRSGRQAGGPQQRQHPNVRVAQGSRARKQHRGHRQPTTHLTGQQVPRGCPSATRAPRSTTVALSWRQRRHRPATSPEPVAAAGCPGEAARDARARVPGQLQSRCAAPAEPGQLFRQRNPQQMHGLGRKPTEQATMRSCLSNLCGRP